MKKLMFAAAALASVTAFAAIESDVVGYNTAPLKEGNTMVPSQFVSVTSSEGFNLYSFIPTGVEESSQLFLYVLNEYGSATSTYNWVPEYPNDDGTFGAWCNKGGSEKQPDTTFAIGTGLWIQGHATFSIQTSGKVYMKPVEVALKDGSTATGNPYPVQITLDEILVEGASASSEVLMYLLNEYGGAEATYNWVPDMEWIDANNQARVGAWCNKGGSVRQEATLPAGQGLWVQGHTNYKLIFDVPSSL